MSMQAIVQSKLKATNESSHTHKARGGGALSSHQSAVCLRLSTRDPSRLMMLTLTQGSERWHHNGHTHARARGPCNRSELGRLLQSNDEGESPCNKTKATLLLTMAHDTLATTKAAKGGNSLLEWYERGRSPCNRSKMPTCDEISCDALSRACVYPSNVHGGMGMG